MDFINKLFKAKAKNSDDEATIGSVYNQSGENEPGSSSEPTNVCKNESKGLFNRKKKRTLSFYENKSRQYNKHPGSAKIRPVSDKPNKNKEMVIPKNGDQIESFIKSSSIDSEPKPVLTLIENKERILEQFDPLWVSDVKREEKLENSLSKNNSKKPVKPTRNKVHNEKDMSSRNLAVMKIPDLKVVKMECIQENEVSLEEENIVEMPDDVNDEQVFAKANVSYEGLEGVFASAVIHDNFDAVKEDVFPITKKSDTVNFALPNDLASTSYSEVQPVSVQPRKNPWNVWPGLFEESLGAPTKDPFINTLDDDSKISFDNWSEESNPIDQLGLLLFQANKEEEKRTDKMIADFFSEEERTLNEQDIAKYSNNIEISKIEIYEEDIKRYHQSLKYRRKPVDHDIIFTTVETALNFIEKLTKEREQKKKVGFLPELLEKYLKTKAKREQEKEEEEKKKKEKEENQKKDPLKPKMWLVFNRLSKEKVIICTPGEFYDSD